MKFYTCGFIDSEPAAIVIEINIKKRKAEKDMINFKAENIGAGTQVSLVRASNLFARVHKKYFEGNHVDMWIKCSHMYAAPFITSLILTGYYCDMYKLKDLDVMIIGDLTSDGKSTGNDFDIIKIINEKNLFNQYQKWFNLSAEQIEIRIATIVIQRWWRINKMNKIKKIKTCSYLNQKFIVYV